MILSTLTPPKDGNVNADTYLRKFSQDLENSCRENMGLPRINFPPAEPCQHGITYPFCDPC